MKILIVLALAVAASAFPEPQLVHRNRVMPVQDNIEGRIINGKEAAVGQFPYQVALDLHISALRQAFCGGSLISNSWVLTAAHCTDGVPSVTVSLGATLRTSAEVKYRVYSDDIKIHKGWNSNNLANDISLIKIPDTAYTPLIRNIAIPAKSNSYSSYVGDVVIASGWGRTSDLSNSVASKLMFVEMVVESNDVCSKVYGSAVVRPSVICLSTNTHQKGSTCNGDSGGPIVLIDSKYQIGLTSFGAAAGCEKGYPVAFTRLTSYLDWIEEHTGV